MLISVYLPFSDYRRLMVEGFSRLARPAWPTPDVLGAHLRSVGSIRYRRKQGFDGWVGEDRLAFGVNALTIQLPRRDHANGLGRLRLIRKACFFDGLTNGRIELLFSVEPKIQDRSLAFAAARRFLDLKTRVAKQDFEGPLWAAPKALGKLWAAATVKHGQTSHHEWVRVGRPVCIVESEHFLGIRKPGQQRSSNPVTELALVPGPKPIELLLISQLSDDHTSINRGSDFRLGARYVRTYILRLLQNVESLSLLFSLPLESIDDDKIQNLFNEYTRQINRSRQRMENFEVAQVVDYCYSAFERLYPARTEGIRIQLQNSGIRPNVIRKMLQFVEIAEASTVKVSNLTLGDQVQGDKVMGDKYENVNISGQGVAIGRGAAATVSQSTNAPVNNESISSALNALAELIRKSGHSDAGVEATIVEAAAKKAEEGDENGAVALLKKSAGWVLDLAKSAGGAVLAAFLKSHLGMS